MANDDQLNRLKEKEGFSATAFWDVKQHTIGYGTNLDDADVSKYLIDQGYDIEQLRSGKQQLSEEHGEGALRIAHTRTVGAVKDVLPNFDSLAPEAQDVAIDMAYNMGASGLAGFKNMISSLSSDDPDYEAAAGHLMDSKYARGEVTDANTGETSVLPGLTKRAESNRDLLLEASKKKEAEDFYVETPPTDVASRDSFFSDSPEADASVEVLPRDEEAVKYQYSMSQMFQAGISSPVAIQQNQQEILGIYAGIEQKLKDKKLRQLRQTESLHVASETAQALGDQFQQDLQTDYKKAANTYQVYEAYIQQEAEKAAKAAHERMYWESQVALKRHDPAWRYIDTRANVNYMDRVDEFAVKEMVIGNWLTEQKAKYDGDDSIFGDMLDLVGYIFGQYQLNVADLADAASRDEGFWKGVQNVFQAFFFEGDAHKEWFDAQNIEKMSEHELREFLDQLGDKISETGSVFHLGRNSDAATRFFDGVFSTSNRQNNINSFLSMVFTPLDIAGIVQIAKGFKVAPNLLENITTGRKAVDDAPVTSDAKPQKVSQHPKANVLSRMIHAEMNPKITAASVNRTVLHRGGTTAQLVEDAIVTMARGKPLGSVLYNHTDEAIAEALPWKITPQKFVGMSAWTSMKITQAMEAFNRGINAPYIADIPEQVFKDLQRTMPNLTPKGAVVGRAESGLVDSWFDFRQGAHFLNFDLVSRNGRPFATKGKAEEYLELWGYETGKPGEAFDGSFRPQATVEQLEDGGWVVRVKNPVRSEDIGKMKFDIHNIEQRHGNRWLKDYKSLTDEWLGKAASKTTFAREKIQQTMASEWRKAMSGIFGKQKRDLKFVMETQRRNRQWMSARELRHFYVNNLGRHMTQAEERALMMYKVINDQHYLIENQNIRRELLKQGYQSIYMPNFVKGHQSTMSEFIGKEHFEVPADIDKYYMWDSFSEQEIKMTRAEWDEYQLTHGKQMIIEPRDKEAFRKMIGGKRPYKYVIGAREDASLTKAALTPYPMNYVAGGRIFYDNLSHLVSQRTKAETTKNGVHFNAEISTIAGAQSKKEAWDWANRYNKINEQVEAFRRGEIPEAELLKTLEQNRYSGLQEYLDELQEWGIRTDEKLIVREDAELATTTKNADEDIAELGSDAYERNRAFYGSRGTRNREGLRMLDGSDAKLVDPIDTANMQINLAASSGAFHTFRIQALEKFKNTFGAAMKNPDDDALQMVMYGRPDRGKALDQEAAKVGLGSEQLAKSIEAHQAYINQILHTGTSFDASVANATKHLAEKIDYSKSLRKIFGDTQTTRAANWVYQQAKINPIERLRYLTFDLKLGLFALPQLFQQAQGATLAVFLDPKNGMKAAVNLMPIKAMLMANDPAWRQTIANKTYSLLGYRSADEMMGVVEQFDRLGLNSFGTAMATADAGFNQLGNTTIDAMREQGRVFFMAGEKVSRIVAHQIAMRRWNDNVIDSVTGQHVNPNGLDFRHADAEHWILGETDRLLFGPMSENNPAFTKSWGSLTFQFWNHNAKILNAMLPTKAGNVRYTNKDKALLAAGSVAFYGSTGIPLLTQAYNTFFQTTGVEPDDMTAKLMYSGAIDGLLYWASDGEWDMEIGRKWAVGAAPEDLYNRIFERGDLSVLLGAGPGTVVKSVGNAFDVWERTAMWEDPDLSKLSSGIIKSLSTAVSSLSQVQKAYVAYKLGIIEDSRGGVLDTINTGEAVLKTLTAAQTKGEYDTFLKIGLLSENSEDVQDYARQLVILWRQRQRETDPKERAIIESYIQAYSASLDNNPYVLRAAERMLAEDGDTMAEQVGLSVYLKDVETPASVPDEDNEDN